MGRELSGVVEGREMSAYIRLQLLCNYCKLCSFLRKLRSEGCNDGITLVRVMCLLCDTSAYIL